MPREQFSRVRTLDLRLSMSAAICRRLRELQFVTGPGQVGFAQVFEEWPDYLDQFVSPAACVLPQGELRYADARLTPTLLEDTWEPGDGLAGWGLYTDADGECDFNVVIRTPTVGERTAVVQAIEGAFLEDGILMNHVSGRRYGRIVTMDEYFRLPCRLSLQSVRVLDDQDTVKAGAREAEFLVRAQAPKAEVGPVQPFKLKIVQTTD